MRERIDSVGSRVVRRELGFKVDAMDEGRDFGSTSHDDDDEKDSYIQGTISTQLSLSQQLTPYTSQLRPPFALSLSTSLSLSLFSSASNSPSLHPNHHSVSHPSKTPLNSLSADSTESDPITPVQHQTISPSPPNIAQHERTVKPIPRITNAIPRSERLGVKPLGFKKVGRANEGPPVCDGGGSVQR